VGPRARLVVALAVGALFAAVGSVVFQVIASGGVTSWAAAATVAALVTLATLYAEWASVTKRWRDG
jgi:uncharacterized membrane protein YhaH (DUF805 family)